jgi:hypothetical protein
MSAAKAESAIVPVHNFEEKNVQQVYFQTQMCCPIVLRTIVLFSQTQK